MKLSVSRHASVCSPNHRASEFESEDRGTIPVEQNTFDYVLCTEVLEHVPKPVDTIRELSRVLKPGGTLILTVPMNCLRHFDPYFYKSGLTDNWIMSTFAESELIVKTLEPVGDYHGGMKVEVFRTISQTKWNPLAYLPLPPPYCFMPFRKRPVRALLLFAWATTW